MASLDRVASLLKDECHSQYAWSKLAGTPLAGLRKAAVLIPLVVRDGEVYVWLTLRSEKVTHDQGHVSFPGGMKDDHDQNEVDTCLRESHEEIGLEKHHVQILGMTFPRINARGILITPVIAIISPEFVPRVNEEVEVAFQLPLKRFLNTDGHHSTPYTVHGNNMIIHHFTDTVGNREIRTWGLTAHMCVELAMLLFRQAPDYVLLADSLTVNVDNPYDYQQLYLLGFMKRTMEEQSSTTNPVSAESKL